MAIEIRLATSRDCAALESVERAVYGRRVMPCLSQQDFRERVACNPEGLIVAVVDGEICAYVYTELAYLDQYDPRRSGNAFWDILEEGFKRIRHEPGGNAVHGVSVAAKPGRMPLSRKLIEAVLENGEASRRDYIFFLARIPSAASFLKGVGWRHGRKEARVREALRNYCVRSARTGICPLSGGRSLSRRDPVVSLFARFAGAQFLDIFQSSFPDPESMNSCALMIRRFNQAKRFTREGVPGT